MTWLGLLLNFILTIAGVVIGLIIYGYRPVDRWRWNYLPGEYGKWFVGNREEMSAKGQHHFQLEKAKQYGPIFHVTGYLGPEIVIAGPDLARQVLLSNLNRSPLPGVLDTRLYKSHPGFHESHIITAKDDHWRSLREAFDPFFLPGSLEAFAKQMSESARVLTGRIDAVAGTGELFDVYSLMVDLAMDIVLKVSLGIEIHTQDPENATPEERQVVKDAYALMHNFTSSIWFLIISHFPVLRKLLHKIALRYPDQKLTDLFAAQHRIIYFVQQLLQDHRAKLAEDKNGKATPLPNGHASERPSDLVGKAEGSKRRGIRPGCFLDLLARGRDRHTGKPFLEGTIIRQGHAMILAGYETTAVTLATTMYNLSRDQEAQTHVAREALGQPESPTLDSVESMPWADAAIKESLRLYPSAPNGGREAQQDMILGGYKIKKGAPLKVALWALQRHPDLWERPDDFVPARWIDGTPEAAKRPKDAWFGFGGGSRGCPGQRFAMEEAKIALVHMMRRFSFKLGPGQVPLPLRHTMTLAPSKGVWVTAERRSK